MPSNEELQGAVRAAREGLQRDLEKLNTAAEVRWHRLSMADGTDGALSASLFVQGLGPVRVLIPFRGIQVLPAEFRADLGARAPATLALGRSLQGGFASGTWELPADQREDPAARTVVDHLADEAELREGIDWDHELDDGSVVQVPWALQLIPVGSGSILLGQTAPIGILARSPGLELFVTQARRMRALLEDYAAPAADSRPPLYRALLVDELPAGELLDADGSLPAPRLSASTATLVPDDDWDPELSQAATERAAPTPVSRPLPAPPRPTLDARPASRFEEAAPKAPVARRPSMAVEQRPGAVTAMGVMHLVGGIMAVISAVIIALSTFFIYIPWIYGLVTGILLIVKGAQLLGGNSRGLAPPKTTSILQIVNIINCDWINMTLGIISLSMMSRPEVEDWFEGR